MSADWAPPPPPPPTRSAGRPAPEWSSNRRIAMVAAGMIVVGALLPWATFETGLFSRSFSGFEGDGLITGGIGVVCVLLVWDGGRRAFGWSAALAAVVGATALYDGWHLQRIIDDEMDPGIGSVGVGLWATGIGAVLLFAGSMSERDKLNDVSAAGADVPAVRPSPPPVLVPPKTPREKRHLSSRAQNVIGWSISITAVGGLIVAVMIIG